MIAKIAVSAANFAIDKPYSYRIPENLTVYPGQTVTIKDAAPYGILCLQGYGTFGEYPLETPTLIRYGQATYDEYFVTEKAAREGVTITNASATEPIVILKHFAENDDLPQGL